MDTKKIIIREWRQNKNVHRWIKTKRTQWQKVCARKTLMKFFNQKKYHARKKHGLHRESTHRSESADMVKVNIKDSIIFNCSKIQWTI